MDQYPTENEAGAKTPALVEELGKPDGALPDKGYSTAKVRILNLFQKGKMSAEVELDRSGAVRLAAPCRASSVISQPLTEHFFKMGPK